MPTVGLPEPCARPCMQTGGDRGNWANPRVFPPFVPLPQLWHRVPDWIPTAVRRASGPPPPTGPIPTAPTLSLCSPEATDLRPAEPAPALLSRFPGLPLTPGPNAVGINLVACVLDVTPSVFKATAISPGKLYKGTGALLDLWRGRHH